MNAATIGLDKWIEPLLELLDDEQRHAQRAVEHLDALRAAVIRRDEDTLRVLLARIHGDQEQTGARESRREQIRQQIAQALGCKPEQVNLSRLCEAVGSPLRERIRQRQRSCQETVRRLQNEHRLTTLLLRDCARINQALLRCLLQEAVTVPTYNAKGHSNWYADSGVVHLRA